MAVHAQHFRAELAAGQIFLTQLGEVLAHHVQLFQVKARVVIGTLKRSHKALGGHMAGAQRQRADGRINNIRARLNALQDGHGSKAGGVVAVDVHGDGNSLFQGLHQFIGRVRRQQAGHILDADAVRSHLLQGLGVLGEILVVVHGAQRIADAALHMRLFLNGGFDGRLQVARVVQRVENTQDVNAVGNGLLHEILDGVVRVMAVAQHVLAAEQHLQLGVRHFLAQDAQASHGSSSRKRMQESNVAPPQHSTE